MENLPLPYLFIDWNGERIRYPMTSDAEVGTTYKDLAEYDPELWKQFKSVKGYIKYHKDLQAFTDNYESGKITKEQRDQGHQLVESQKDYYKELE